jgi:hypothetical protein
MSTSTKPRATVAPIFRKQAAAQMRKTAAQHAQLRDAFNRSGVATFVSTSMCVAHKDAQHIVSELIYVGDAPHYRLTPLFWAYLRHAFDNATRACATGKLGGDTYSELLDRLSRVYNMAHTQYDAEDLNAARRQFTLSQWHRHCERLAQALTPGENVIDADTGSTHRAHRFPAYAAGACRPVSKTALALVDSIRDKALAAGWSINQLYRNVGIDYRDWGLVCCLGPSETIGEITGQYIEIVLNSQSAPPRSLRFYNNDVEQPWLKAKTPEVTA